jgi:flagellar export protein FliJ
MRSDRLRRIIELKARLMEEKERVLDQYNKDRDIICSNIAQLDADIDMNYNEVSTRCLSGNEFLVLRDYLEHLSRMRKDASAQKELVESKIAAVRKELYEMLKEIKMLDGLKERTLSAARKAENRRHQKLLDEIALRLEGRKA